MNLRNRLHDESGRDGGFTLVELLVTMLILGIIMTGLANVFVSGTHTQVVLNGELNAQQSVRLALDRLEFDGRCATSATIVSSGAGVSFTLPNQCVHVHGTVTWCVVSGVLKRYLTSSCTGTAIRYVSYLTSATPFSLVTGSGLLPQLRVALTANPTGLASGIYTVADTFTLRNSARAG